MPRPLLPGFTYSRSVARYRDTSTGRFVAKSRITDLLEANVNGSEQRLGDIVQGVFAKEISPGAAQEAMRDELRRLSLQNAALGKGGIEQLDFRDYGRAGRQLRDTYHRMTNLVDGIERGEVTMAQALNRVHGYTSEARAQFFAAQRDAQRATGRIFEERRTLHARESCGDCVALAASGWQPQGMLPLPCDGSTECGKYCRCTMESREVTVEQARERMFA